MCPQSACMRGCKVTLVAFVWLFSAVCFQMCPQIACIWGCIVTLVAFVRLYPTVCFQMCPQSACMRGCKVALVASTYVTLYYCLHFSSNFQHLLVSNEYHNFQSFAPLSLCVMFYLNCCFKLSKIYHWSPIITTVHFSMAYFHFFKCLDERIYIWHFFLQKLPYRKHCQRHNGPRHCFYNLNYISSNKAGKFSKYLNSS